MSVIVAELVARFTGEDSSFREANLRTQQGLLKTARNATETAEAMLQLTSSIALTDKAFDGLSLSGANYTRVMGDAAKASFATEAAFQTTAKGLGSLDAAFVTVIGTAKIATTEMTAAGTSAGALATAAGAARTEVGGLGRSLGSTAASGYAKRTEASVLAVESLGLTAKSTNAEVAALNATIASGKTLRLSSASGGSGGGGNFSAKALGVGSAAGKGLTNYVTAPIMLADALSLKFAADFDQSMRNVNSLTKLNALGFDAMRASVLALAEDKKIKQMPLDLAEGLYDIVGRGFKPGAEALDLLRESAYGASAGMTTTLTAASALGSVLKSNISGVKTAKEASDVLFRTVDLGALTYEQLASAIPKLLPLATAAGVSLQELGAGFVVLTNQGNTAAESATAYVNLLSHIVKPSKEAGDVMKALGVSYGIAALEGKGLAGWLKEVSEKTGGNKQALIALMPELRGMKGLLASVNDGGKGYADALRLMGDATKSQGSSQAALAEQMKGVNFQAAEAKKQLALAAISLGDELVPAARDAIAVVRDMAKWFSGLDKETRSNIVRWGLYAAAMGPAIKAGTTLAGGIKAIVGLRSAYVDFQKAAAVANLATAGSAEVATAAVAGLSTATLALMGLAAVPIVVTVMYKTLGKDLLDEQKEAVEGNKKAYREYEDEQLKSARKVLREKGLAYLQNTAGKRDVRGYVPYAVADVQRAVDAEAKAKRMAEQKEFNDFRTNSAARYAAKQKAEADRQLAQEEAKRKAASDRAAGIVANLDAKKSRTAHHSDPLDQYREQQYQLQKTLRLGDKPLESASMAYDILHRHLDGLNEAVGKAKGTDLGAEIVKRAGESIKTPAGQASCAYFASAVLQAAGTKVPGSASAKGLRDQLVASGATPHPASEARSGDVIVWHGKRYGAIKDADGQGYHAGIAMGGGAVRASSGGRVRTRPMYDAAHATAYTLPGAGGASESDILAMAQRAYGLQLQIEKADRDREEKKRLAEKLKGQNEASRELVKAAQQAANQASREALAFKVLADRNEKGDPTMNALAIREHGKRFAELPKAIQQAIAQRASAMKNLQAAQYDASGAAFDDGSEKAAENKSRRAERASEAARRSAEDFDAIVRANLDKRDEGAASTSLAARRAQYVKEQVSGLKSTGELATDLERQRQVAEAAGQAFDATPVRAYRTAVRDLSRQIAELGPQTDEARLAAIRFDQDGLERMDEASARAVLALEKVAEKMRSQKETARQAGDALGQAFTGAMVKSYSAGARRPLAPLYRWQSRLKARWTKVSPVGIMEAEGFA